MAEFTTRPLHVESPYADCQASGHRCARNSEGQPPPDVVDIRGLMPNPPTDGTNSSSHHPVHPQHVAGWCLCACVSQPLQDTDIPVVTADGASCRERRPSSHGSSRQPRWATTAAAPTHADPRSRKGTRPAAESPADDCDRELPRAAATGDSALSSYAPVASEPSSSTDRICRWTGT